MKLNWTKLEIEFDLGLASVRIGKVQDFPPKTKVVGVDWMFRGVKILLDISVIGFPIRLGLMNKLDVMGSVPVLALVSVGEGATLLKAL